MISKLLRCLRLEKMIWRRGKSGVISNVEFGMLLILPCVVLASSLSTTVAWHHSPPVACAPSSVPSPPVPSAPSSVPLPPLPSAPSSVPSPPLVPSAPSSVPSPPLVPSAPSSVPSPPIVPSAPSSVPSPPLVPSAPSSVPSPPIVPSAPSSVPSPPLVPSAPSSVPSPPLVPSAPSSVPSPPVPSAPSSVPSRPLLPSAPSSVPSPRLAPNAPSSVPSPPAPFAPRSVPSPPFCSPSAPSPVPSPPFCSRSLATTIGSAVLAIVIKDAWGRASGVVAFTRRNVDNFWSNRSFWWKVLWTIVLGLNPIVGTFYVLQTMFVTCNFLEILRQPGMAVGAHANAIAKCIAGTWVAVGVADPNIIPNQYILNRVNPDPDLVLNLAGTVDRQGNRQWPTASSFHVFLLSYDGILALLCSGVLNNANYQQLRFLGSETDLQTVIVILQSMSYVTALVYRRIKHLKVTPIEGIGFAGSLLFLVHVFVQYKFAPITKKGLLIYLTPAQEQTIQHFGNGNQQPQRAGGWDPNCRAFILTSLVGFVVVIVATWLLYPVLATKNKVDMLGHIFFFGDFVLQFIFFIVYYRQCFGIRLYPGLLVTTLLITGIIAFAGVALAIIATIRHWHDQNFNIPTPLLGRYFPFIG